MDKINPVNIAAVVFNHYRLKGFVQKKPTACEIDFAAKLIDILDGASSPAGAKIEVESNLVFGTGNSSVIDSDSDTDADLDESEEESEAEDTAAPPGSEDPPSSNSYEYVKKKKRETISETYKRRAVTFLKSNTSKTTLLNYKRCRSRETLYSWKKQIEEGKGNSKEKFQQIRQAVLDRFQAETLACHVIHDVDLKRWGLMAARAVQFPTFRASRAWVNRLKKECDIVSRKITKFVTAAERDNEEELEETAKEFVAETDWYFDTLDAENIFNTDQSGFQKKLHSKRTLAPKGSKKVHSVVQSVSATTHSYSIQTTLSASRRNVEKLLVVLQEPNGKFGPQVHQKMFRAENLLVLASKSGKLEKRHNLLYFQELFYADLPLGDFLIYLDSWSGFKDQEAFLRDLPEDRFLHVEIIPPKTTKYIQPCDKFYFRQYKNFVRYFSDYVLVENMEVKLAERNSILKLQSLAHNQFCSPRYVKMIQYAWSACGYNVKRPEDFLTPVEFSFSKVTECSNCAKAAFLRCGWCKNQLCFEDFFGKYHYCKEFVL